MENNMIQFTEQEARFIKTEFQKSQFWHSEGIKEDILKKLVEFIERPVNPSLECQCTKCYSERRNQK